MDNNNLNLMEKIYLKNFKIYAVGPNKRKEILIKISKRFKQKLQYFIIIKAMHELMIFINVY